MISRVNLLVLLVALLVACVKSEVSSRELGEFSAILTCLPFNLLIKPSEGEYSLTIDSDEGIDKVVSAEVSEGVLQLSAKTGFTATQPIKAWVTLPSDKLKEIVGLGGGNVVVQQGFKAKKLKVVKGSGEMIILDIRVDDLVLESKNIGKIIVDGKIKKARVFALDASNVYLKGVSDSVKASVDGVSGLFIISASENLQVTGRAVDVSKVRLSQGRCKVKGGFGFGQPCILESIAFPTRNPLYSCGLVVSGSQACGSGNSGGPKSQTSASPSASSVAIASTNCDTKDDAALKMFS